MGTAGCGLHRRSVHAHSLPVSTAIHAASALLIPCHESPPRATGSAVCGVESPGHKCHDRLRRLPVRAVDRVASALWRARSAGRHRQRLGLIGLPLLGPIMTDWLAVVSNPHVIASILYLLALVGVGGIKARSVGGDAANFHVAGRALQWPVLVGTLLATWIGNGSLFGSAGLSYRNGLAGLWPSTGSWIGILIVHRISKRIRNLGSSSVPEILALRYSRLAADLGTVTTLVAYITIVSYQFKGGAKVISVVTAGAVPEAAATVMVAVLTVIYTILAGMLSVVYTDVVNGVIMLAGVGLALAYMLYLVGGPGALQSTAADAGKWSLLGHWEEESLTQSGGSAELVISSFFVPNMLLLLGDANMYQRIFSAKDSGSAHKAVLCWFLGVVVLESSISLLALTGAVAASQGLIPDLALGGPGQTETVIPTLAFSLLPTAIGMVLVACMLAVIVSTADSFLLVPATNLARDVYGLRVKPDASGAELIFVTRVLILCGGVVAFILSDRFPTILAAANTSYLIYGTSITPSLLAAFTWRRATSTGAVASICTGAVVTIVWKYFVVDALEGSALSNPFLLEVSYPAALSSIAALVLGSYATEPPPARVWQQFMNDGDSAAVAVEGRDDDDEGEEEGRLGEAAGSSDDEQALLGAKGR